MCKIYDHKAQTQRTGARQVFDNKWYIDTKRKSNTTCTVFIYMQLKTLLSLTLQDYSCGNVSYIFIWFIIHIAFVNFCFWNVDSDCRRLCIFPVHVSLKISRIFTQYLVSNSLQPFRKQQRDCPSMLPTKTHVTSLKRNHSCIKKQTCPDMVFSWVIQSPLSDFKHTVLKKVNFIEFMVRSFQILY